MTPGMAPTRAIQVIVRERLKESIRARSAPERSEHNVPRSDADRIRDRTCLPPYWVMANKVLSTVSNHDPNDAGPPVQTPHQPEPHPGRDKSHMVNYTVVPSNEFPESLTFEVVSEIVRRMPAPEQAALGAVLPVHPGLRWPRIQKGLNVSKSIVRRGFPQLAVGGQGAHAAPSRRHNSPSTYAPGGNAAPARDRRPEQLRARNDRWVELDGCWGGWDSRALTK